MKQMLIVNDDKKTVRNFEGLFRREGFVITAAFSEAQAYATLGNVKPDIVLLDMDLTGCEEDCSGITVLKHIRKKWSKKELPVIILSRYLDGDRIGEVERIGINDNDYAPLPVVDTRRLLRHVNSYFETPDTTVEPHFANGDRPYFRSPQSILWLKKLKQLAVVRKDLLLMGEPGSGKTRMAQYYYELMQENQGPRKLPWVRIGCVEYSETLFEANVFGEKSPHSATGHSRPGLIEKGKHGVIFFDDVAFLPRNLQGKLLDVLATKHYRPLGARTVQALDCVFVLALHTDKSNPNFDETFLSRLKRMSTLEIPPLRERPEDLRGLVERMVARFSLQHKGRMLRMDPEVFTRLEQQEFPGNISDLEAVIEDGVLVCPSDTLTADDIEDVLRSHRKLHGLGDAATPQPESQPNDEVVEGFGALRVLPQKHEAYAGEKRLDLRPMEYELLRLFIRNAEHVVTREAIMEALHQDPATVVTENAVTSQVKNLRKKVSPYDRCIETVSGVGYKLTK